MRNKSRVVEILTGYIMVFPALLIVGLISLYPIIRTFHYSTFDYQLNNPVRNTLNKKTRFDLEKYLGAQFYLDREISGLEEGVKEENKEELSVVIDGLKKTDEEILSFEEVKKNYDEVNKMVSSMIAVRDEEMKYVIIPQETANELRSRLNDYSAILLGMSETPGDEYSQASGLIDEISSCILMPNNIGFMNYLQLFDELGVKSGELGRLGRALLNTFGFTIITVLVELILGIIVAQLANHAFRGRGLIRACMLVPWAVPTALSAMMWRFMYDGQTGIVSFLFYKLGIISSAGSMLGSISGSVFGIILADVWKTTPYVALLILAGLQFIPGQLYESSQIDGANRWQTFFRITLPMLKPTLLVALLFRSLDAFRVFDLIVVLTNGGPGYATESLSVYAYKTMFSQMDFGKGSALAIILFLCVVMISCFFIKVLGTEIVDKE